MTKIVLTILGLITVALWVCWGVGTWFLDRDTTYLLTRAQVAANAADMQGYINQLQENMERRGMTEGYAALVFKTPENNMALIYDVVKRVNQRLTSIKDISQNETTYQVALDDLRGTLREFNLHTGGWFWVHNAWWIIISFVTIAIIMAMGIVVIAGDW